jgi:hypothetical protein
MPHVWDPEGILPRAHYRAAALVRKLAAFSTKWLVSGRLDRLPMSTTKMVDVELWDRPKEMADEAWRSYRPFEHIFTEYDDDPVGFAAAAERKDVVESLANGAQFVFDALADERRRAKRASKRAQKRARSVGVGGTHGHTKRPAPSSPTSPTAQDMHVE